MFIILYLFAFKYFSDSFILVYMDCLFTFASDHLALYMEMDFDLVIGNIRIC